MSLIVLCLLKGVFGIALPQFYGFKGDFLCVWHEISFYREHVLCDWAACGLGRP